MSEKHTPGPWKYGGGMYVTSNGVPDRFVRASSGIVAYCEGPIDEARANARLIAAAPDLLEALRELPDDVGMIVSNPEEGAYFFCCGAETYALIGKMQHAPDCWYIKLRAAIAKATGGAFDSGALLTE